MRKNYLKGTFLCLALAAGMGVSAADTKTTAVFTYGSLEDGSYSTTPTLVVRSFYDADGRLARKMEADVMLADNDLTIEVETPGEEVPRIYTLYDYDENGNLLKVRTRKYGIYSGYHKGWADYAEAEAYEYNAEGQMTKKTDATYVTEYKWEEGKLTEETACYVADGKWSNTVKYTAHDEAGKPLAALFSDTWGNARYYEYAYDAEGNKTLYRECYVTGAQKDENNVLVAGEKGDIYSETTWEYADGALVKEQKGFWNSGKAEVVPSVKVEYTAVGDTTTIATYAYNAGSDAWYKNGSTKKSVSEVMDGEMVATDLAIEDVEGLINTVKLTAKAPEGAKAEGWMVFRNGMPVGEAELADGVLSYQDSLVANGTWDYFLQYEEKNISQPAEKTFETILPGVTGIQVVKNSLNKDGNYEVQFLWSAPSTTLEIQGYNVYTDISSTDANPLPVNGLDVIPASKAPQYVLTWASGSDKNHEIYVEAIYSVGKARSNAYPVTLQSEESPKLTSVVITLGEMQDAVAPDVPSRADVYYYDNNNRLQYVIGYEIVVGDDDPLTHAEVLYKSGEYIPASIMKYVYNEQGQLVNTYERDYGMYSGYNRVWSDFVEEGKFDYDEQGRMIADTTTNRVYQYTYDENNNVVKEVYANSRNIIIYNKYYSDFVEGLVNCPRYAFANSPYGLTTNDRIYEFTYDENGNKTSCYVYKYDNSTIVKDEDGNVINAEKGTPDYMETWTYENGFLTEYNKAKWNTSRGEYIGSNRTEYTVTDLGVLETSYSYQSYISKWTKSGLPKVTQTLGFGSKKAIDDLTVTQVEGKVNTLLLSASIPTGGTPNTVYNVFRNGRKIGEAVRDGRKLSFEDENVANGNWIYFIQEKDNHDNTIGINISNPVEITLDTYLPPVKEIRVVTNGVTSVKDYQLDVEWDAPETDLTILGYDIYVDVKDMTKNPSPVNGLHYFTDLNYSFTYSNDITNLEKTIYVETIYNIGKAKSDVLSVTLSKESITDGIGETVVKGGLTVTGNMVNIAGAYNSLEVYNANGVVVAAYSEVQTVDLSALAGGLYVLRLNTTDGVETLKTIVK